MNSHAVAGPSSQPYQDPSVIKPVTKPPPPPQATPTIARSVNGPKIIPTILHEDGIKEVPHFFEMCQVDDLIVLIASMLDRLISHNDRIPLTPTSLTRFHSRAPPTINIVDYLTRIERYTNVEAAVLLILLPYVDKVCSRWTTFTVNSLSVHRFVIAGVSVGSKALSDSFCTNGRYARVGGVSLAEMCLLEKELCEAIDWRLTTTGAVLAHYYTSLVRSHPSYRLPPGEIPIPSKIHPLDHVPFTSLDSLPSSTTSSKRSSMNITDTDIDGDADMEEGAGDDSGPISPNVVNGNGGIEMTGIEINNNSSQPLPPPPPPSHNTPQFSHDAISTPNNTKPHSPSTLSNSTNGFSHKGKTTTSLTPPEASIHEHHSASPSTIPSTYFPPSISVPIEQSSRIQGPALIPPKNLSSNRLVSASNLPSPVRIGRSLSDSIEGSLDSSDELGREVKRRLLRDDITRSPGATSFKSSNGSGSSLSSPNSTTGISPRIVQIGLDALSKIEIDGGLN